MDNYPPGAANDPNAPWNQSEPDPINVDVCASVTLSRSATISVDDYTAEEWVDYDTDDEGRVLTSGGISYDLSNSNLLQIFKGQEYTVLELLAKCKEFATEKLERETLPLTEQRRLRGIIESCDSWTVDEEEVVEE